MAAPLPSPSALHDTLDGEECVVEFDFLGKDSIRYQNKVPVDRQVFKNLKLFVKGKRPEDDLFDRLNVRQGSVVCRVGGEGGGDTIALSDACHGLPQTSVLNKHLQDLMEGLTAKVWVWRGGVGVGCGCTPSTCITLLVTWCWC